MLLNQSKRLTGLNIEQLRNELPFPVSQLTERFLPSSVDAGGLQQSFHRESDVEIRNLLQDYDDSLSDDRDDWPDAQGGDEEEEELQ